MAGQIDTYREEIFNFLRTVSIKFEPFAYLMGQSYMDAYGLDDPHGEWNPYYVNLSGEYSKNDTRMTVYSLEENRHVPFDKDLVKTYPKTAALYRIPHVEYRTLEERYPENTGLIRTIAYPGPSIQEIIVAPNLSLLAYDDSLLHENERESLVGCLRKFLDMVRVRWWIPEYGYEDMYAMTFWSMLWQHLPALLLAQRFRNIRTPHVHPFHIWEYLKSKGLGDYRDVLTNNQSLWLYRNIDYVQKNKGKNSNLVILAENILEEIFVSLLYKDMNQEIKEDWKDTVTTTPIFKSYNIVTGELVKEETFADLNDRLHDEGLELNNTADFVAEKEQELGSHRYNTLPTKFLEFKKEPVNTANERDLINFFLSNFFHRYSQNDLSYNVAFSDSLLEEKLSLYVGDLAALWYWALMRSVGEIPVEIPTSYWVRCCFKKNKPSKASITPMLYYGNKAYETSRLIDIDGLLDSIYFDPKQFVKQSSFMDLLVRQFRAILAHKRQIDASNLTMYHAAMRYFYWDTSVHEQVHFRLSDKDTYAEWIESIPGIKTIVSVYDSQPNYMELYKKLSQVCFDLMFPLDDSTSDEFMGSVRNMERIYTSVRDLFIQLGSYNITYLENERETSEYLRFYDPDFVTNLDTTFTFDGVWDRMHPDMYFSGWFGGFPGVNLSPKAYIRQDIFIPEFQVETTFTGQTSAVATQQEMELSLPTKQEDTWKMKRATSVDAILSETGTHMQVPMRIHVENVSFRPRG